MPNNPDTDTQEPLRTISYRRIVDLSHEIHADIPRWPGDPPVEFEDWASLDREGFRLRRFSMGEHSGTHMNAPGSFHQRGAGIDALNPDSLVLPAAVMDLPDWGDSDADYALTIDDVLGWEGRWGPVAPGAIVLLRTGRSRHWNTPHAYLGLDESGTPHYPAFGREAVNFLLQCRSVAGIGIDAPGVDPGVDTDFSINRLMLAQPRVVLENLTNLDQLPPTGATLVVGRLRLRGGSGSPVSVLAFVP